MYKILDIRRKGGAMALQARGHLWSLDHSACRR
jgi:hypothetical protein